MLNKLFSLQWLAVAGLFMTLAQSAAAAGPDISAALSVMGYGYKVKLLINGTDTGIEGGKSEGRRLFGKGHSMAAKAAPEIRARNFVLVPGNNEITIEYAKIDPKTGDVLDITLEAEGYPQPLLRLTSKAKASDKMVVSVNIADKPPAGFKPLVLGDK